MTVSGELFDGGVQRVHRLTSNDKIKGAFVGLRDYRCTTMIRSITASISAETTKVRWMTTS
jgi:hypothetical protein